MTRTDPLFMTPQHRQQIAHAQKLLASTSLASRISDYAAGPVQSALKQAPPSVKKGVDRAIERAILACLKLAIRSLKSVPSRRPQMRLASAWAGVAGGFAGAFGVAAVPLELPLTTILMLRAIAEIARHHGEDLDQMEARLACVEVFAYGAEKRADVGYYASRAMLGRLASEAASLLAHRGATSASGPMVAAFSKEVASRFGVVVYEKIAASAVPLAGAASAAAINVAFMNHFQKIARGHFMLRRLERIYGPERVRAEFARLEGSSAEG
ncbi:MAG: EcsC family protein [Methylocystis sp.]